MAEFNPITDLMPTDSSEESVDESSEQIKVIRTQLIETRNSVANVLNIIKTKNSLLDRDLDKIRSLNDRLQRTIPRIPIMRGKAGVQFGDTIEEEKKKGGLNIPMLPPRPRSKEKVVTYARPRVKQALDMAGNIIEVRVTSHKETPGLGDKIEITKSPWISQFSGRSLSNTTDVEWGLIPDGGAFDSFTGATITPRAVVRQVFATLNFSKTILDRGYDSLKKME